MRDPRALLDSKLRSLGSGARGGPDNGFLDALNAVARSMNGIETAQIEAISYRTGVMDLRINSDGVETLDRIQKGVSENDGLAAEIQSANADGERVLGRLQVKLQ